MFPCVYVCVCGGGLDHLYPLYWFNYVCFDSIDKICPGIIPNGELSAPCRGKVPVGSTCGYICQLGYQPKFGVSSIDCENSRKWSVNPHSLCTSEYPYF